MTQIPAANPTAPQAEPQEIPFGQILTVFWRGRWIILACTVLGAIAGYLYVEQRGTIWRAQSKIYVEKQGSSMGPESLLLGIGAKNYANTQAEVLLSSDVLEGALRTFHTDFPQAQLFEQGTIEKIWLMKFLSVKVGRDDDIITVSLDSNHKEEACAIVRYVVEGFIAFQKKKQKSSALELHSLLMKDKVKYDGEYEAAVDEQTSYRKENPGVGSESGGLSVLQETWRALNLELAKADNEALAAEAAWNGAKDLQAAPAMLRQILPSLATSGGTNAVPYPPNVQAMTEQILQLQRERADLLVELQPDHPRVKARDQGIADLTTIIAEQDLQFAKSYVDSLHQRYLALKAKRDALATSVALKEKQVYGLDALDADYRKLLAKADRSKDALNSVYERLRMINVDTESEPTFINVLHEARPETAEVASGKPMRLAAALLLGLFAGCGLAWLRGLMDQRIRTADEVRNALHVPILAILPRTNKAERSDKTKTAVEKWDASTHYAEAARSLRTAVYFGMADGEGNLVQVTSPEQADGKTTIAANLAIAMAKAGQRTLLIDADMRKPQQMAQFRLDNELGLSTLLSSNTRKFPSVVQRTDIPELHVMTSGPIPSNPAEMLNSERFEALLAELGEHYDRVIVDSPPVLPVADARIIATKCNATIMAVRVDKSTRKRASAARDMLAAVGAKILGVALNDMPHGIGYGYGAGYGYYGRYASYAAPEPERGGNGNGKNGPEAPVRLRRSKTRREV